VENSIPPTVCITTKKSRTYLGVAQFDRGWYTTYMPLRLAKSLLHVVPLIGIAMLMLVPTGMCICGSHEDEGSKEQHEPGCPKVRKLERPASPEYYAGDPTVGAVPTPRNDACPAGPTQTVVAVAHGPPRGQPIYLTLQTLLI
jgi:hypothetical protein